MQLLLPAPVKVPIQVKELKKKNKFYFLPGKFYVSVWNGEKNLAVRGNSKYDSTC